MLKNELLLHQEIHSEPIYQNQSQVLSQSQILSEPTLDIQEPIYQNLLNLNVTSKQLDLDQFFYLISHCCADSTEDDRGSVHIDDTVDGLGVGGINISNRSADKEEAFIEATKETPKENSKLMVRRGLTTSRENITRFVVELNISNILAEKYLTFTHFSLKWL